MSSIVVVGSLNLDTTVRVAGLPEPGQTVMGEGHFSDTGGKGANQAVAAARLGRPAAMIGAVGRDPAGDRLLASLEASGVSTDAVRRDPELPTGIALITVDATGENTIVVSPGANGGLRSEHVAAHADLLGDADVVLLQLEIPMEAVTAASRLAGGIVVLNPAPGREVPGEVLERTGVLVPNQTELGILTGGPTPTSIDEAADLASTLGGSVVVTLGADGALVVEAGSAVHVPAPAVEAVDPTAAGDAFCGGLADALAGGSTLVEAVHWAVRCGAVAATRWGAQASLPTRSDVEALG